VKVGGLIKSPNKMCVSGIIHGALNVVYYSEVACDIGAEFEFVDEDDETDDYQFPETTLKIMECSVP